jgi:hypothetical protein
MAIAARDRIRSSTHRRAVPNADLARPRHGTARMADLMQIRPFCVR